MRVKYAGFNAFNQCLSSHGLIIDNFIDFCDSDLDRVEFLHGGSVVVIRDKIYVTDGKNNNNKLLNLPDETKIVQVSGSECRILFLDDTGRIFKYDFNCVEQGVTEICKFLYVESSNAEINDKIVRISCGSRLTVALTKGGKVFNVPNLLNFDGTKIIDVQTGREHCLLLDNAGNVFTFGCGSRGQLGHSMLEDEDEPKLVEALAGIKIKQISAGGWHSCAVSYDGDLYTWGWNSNGQMGLKNQNVMATPTVIDINSNLSSVENVVKVACGSKHTVILLDNGKVYGMGWNKYHQLTDLNIEEENVLNPVLIYDFNLVNDNVNRISSLSENVFFDVKCGPWSTALLYKDVNR